MGRHDKKISDFFDQLSGQNKDAPFSTEEEREQAKQRLLQAILANAAPAAAKVRPLTWAYRIAGSVAAIALLCWGISYLWPHPQPEQPLQLTWISTGLREQKRVMLPDSSVVTLNANSQLSFNNRFNKEDRLVTLHKGEAFQYTA